MWIYLGQYFIFAFMLVYVHLCRFPYWLFSALQPHSNPLKSRRTKIWQGTCLRIDRRESPLIHCPKEVVKSSQCALLGYKPAWWSEAQSKARFPLHLRGIFIRHIQDTVRQWYQGCYSDMRARLPVSLCKVRTGMTSYSSRPQEPHTDVSNWVWVTFGSAESCSPSC